MKIGTIEPLEEEKKKKKRRRSGISPGGAGRGNGNGGNGGGGGGNDDGGNFPDGSRYMEPEQEGIPDKAKVVTWFLLLIVLMTFGGLIGAYIMISTNNVLEWKPFDLPVQVWISTALIFASSFTYHLAQKAVFAGDQPTARKWLIVTTALGAAFISSQIIVWFALVRDGRYVYGNPYAGFFYTLTAIHAIHVLGGIIALGSVVLRNWYPTMDEAEQLRTRNLARSVGWYWHFMGILWVILLALLGFWK